jgi:uncharacterized membrane protein
VRRYIALGLALAGLVNATYLTIQHYRHTIVPCSLAHGCETVLTSKYATFLGLPVSLYGVAFFLLALALLAIWPRYRWLLKLLILSGVVVAAYLVYLMAAKIGAYCQYCLLNDAITLLLAVTLLIPFTAHKHNVEPE